MKAGLSSLMISTLPPHSQVIAYAIIVQVIRDLLPIVTESHDSEFQVNYLGKRISLCGMR